MNNDVGPTKRAERQKSVFSGSTNIHFMKDSLLWCYESPEQNEDTVNRYLYRNSMMVSRLTNSIKCLPTIMIIIAIGDRIDEEAS